MITAIAHNLISSLRLFQCTNTTGNIWVVRFITCVIPPLGFAIDESKMSNPVPIITYFFLVFKNPKRFWMPDPYYNKVIVHFWYNVTRLKRFICIFQWSIGSYHQRHLLPSPYIFVILFSLVFKLKFMIFQSLIHKLSLQNQLANCSWMICFTS